MIPSTPSAFTAVTPDPLWRAVEDLKTRQDHLQKAVRELIAQHGDAAVKANIQDIRAILEKAVHDVMQRVDVSTRPLWREAMQMLNQCLGVYKQQLDNTEGRKKLRQLQRELEQNNALIACTSQPREFPEDRLECCVCFDAKVNVSMKCGHLLCATCVQSIDQCPTCRQRVYPEDVRPIYF